MVFAARTDEPPWSDELVETVKELVFDGTGLDVSAFEIRAQQRFCVGHALAVVASAIGASALREEKLRDYDRKIAAAPDVPSKRDPNDDIGQKTASLILPASVWEGCSCRFTPLANSDFAPADDRHFDIGTTEPNALAKRLLDAIREDEVVWSFMDKKDVRAQAAIAFSHCVARYGAMAEKSPPNGWRHGRQLSAEEQITRLCYLCGDKGFIGKPRNPAA